MGLSEGICQHFLYRRGKRLGSALSRKGATHRVYVHERDAGKIAHERDELVEVVSSAVGNYRAEEDEEEAIHILLPLDSRVVLAASREQAVLSDLYRRENLQRRRQEDGERVEELDAID